MSTLRYYKGKRAPRRVCPVYDFHAARKKLRMTQEELAEMLECSKSTIERAERQGTTPRKGIINNLKRLMKDRFGTTSLVPGERDPNPAVAEAETYRKPQPKFKAADGIPELPPALGIIPSIH